MSLSNPPKGTTNEDAELSKVCSTCRTRKPLSEYNFSAGTNRYDVRCRPCKNQFDREWYAKNREKHLNRIKNYRQSAPGKANQTRSHYTSLEKYPEKHTARGKLRYAVARGKIKKQNCEVCDSAKSEAHHYLGYSELHWYDVKWLCRKHHLDAHNFSLESRGVL